MVALVPLPISDHTRQKIDCDVNVVSIRSSFALWILRKHVWANFCLSYHNQKLLDDSSQLQDFGIRNNSQVSDSTPLILAVPLHRAILVHKPY